MVDEKAVHRFIKRLSQVESVLEVLPEDVDYIYFQSDRYGLKPRLIEQLTTLSKLFKDTSAFLDSLERTVFHIERN